MVQESIKSGNITKNLNDAQQKKYDIAPTQFDLATFISKAVAVELNSSQNEGTQFAQLLAVDARGIWLSAKAFASMYNRKESDMYTLRFFPWAMIKNIDLDHVALRGFKFPELATEKVA